MTLNNLPGTSAYYNQHIYPRPGETIALGPHDKPTSAVDWFIEQRIIDPNEINLVLEIGCGAGRNMKVIKQHFPKAKIYGFDGSPYAIEIAQKAFPDVILTTGDFFKQYPFQELFDLIFDITAGIPESSTQEELDQYGNVLYTSLKPGGYAVIEALSSNDPSNRRFGHTGNLVVWEHKGDKKTERLMSLEEAEKFYKRNGFQIVAKRYEIHEDDMTFNEKIKREIIQLVIQKPIDI